MKTWEVAGWVGAAASAAPRLRAAAAWPLDPQLLLLLLLLLAVCRAMPGNAMMAMGRRRRRQQGRLRCRACLLLMLVVVLMLLVLTRETAAAQVAYPPPLLLSPPLRPLPRPPPRAATLPPCVRDGQTRRRLPSLQQRPPVSLALSRRRPGGDVAAHARRLPTRPLHSRLHRRAGWIFL